MPVPPRKAKWQVTADTWSSTKAKAILSSQPPVPLPSRGPLHKLLVTTRRSLPSCTSLGVREAQEAIDTGAVLVLAKLAHWLQQKPCHEMLGSPTDDTDDCFHWAQVVDLLGDLSKSAEAHPAVLRSMYAQLEASGEHERRDPHRSRDKIGKMTYVTSQSGLRHVFSCCSSMAWKGACHCLLAVL